MSLLQCSYVTCHREVTCTYTKCFLFEYLFIFENIFLKLSYVSRLSIDIHETGDDNFVTWQIQYIICDSYFNNTCFFQVGLSENPDGSPDI